MPTDLPDPLPKRLNLGCGFDLRPGFLNVDFASFHNPDLLADVTDLPMLPSGYFDEIVAQDVLEHFERSKTPVALVEWSRLLSDTGTLVVRVPSLLHMADLLAEAEPQGSEAAAKIVHRLYGTQAYTGDYHLAGFTPSILEEAFASAGLVISEIRLRDTWLFDLRAGKNAVAVSREWPRSNAELAALRARRAEPAGAEAGRGDSLGATEPHDETLASANVRLRYELERCRKDLEHSRACVNAMRQSTSWRVTRPIRSVKELSLFKQR